MMFEYEEDYVGNDIFTTSKVINVKEDEKGVTVATKNSIYRLDYI